MPKLVVFRVDAGHEIGVGHVMRCLTLADLFNVYGYECQFLCNNHKGHAEKLIRNRGYKTHLTSIPEIKTSDYVNNWLGSTETYDANRCIDIYKDKIIDVLIVDHYEISYAWEKLFINKAKKIVVIDDLVNRKHECNVLIDTTYNRIDDDYKLLCKANTNLLVGSQYSLLRPDFSELRVSARHKREITNEVKSILINFGGTDSNKYSKKVIDVLIKIQFKGDVITVISSSCVWLSELEKHVSLLPFGKLLVDAKNMAEIMLNSDLAIGSLGTSTWERCCLGLPCISLQVADNQKWVLESLSNTQAIIPASLSNIEKKIMSIIKKGTSIKQWKDVSDSAFSITDGLGAERVVNEIIGPIVDLIPFSKENTDKLYSWQCEPNARAYSGNNYIPDYEHHAQWVTASMNNELRRMWLVCLNSKPVGYVRLDVLDNNKEEVSILLTEKCHGKGVGKKALNLLIEERKFDKVVATVHPNNTPSIKIFEKSGFKNSGSDNNWEWSSGE